MALKNERIYVSLDLLYSKVLAILHSYTFTDN